MKLIGWICVGIVFVGLGVCFYMRIVRMATQPNPQTSEKTTSIDHSMHQMPTDDIQSTEIISIIPTVETTQPIITKPDVTPEISKPKPKKTPIFDRVPGTTGPLYIFNQAAYEAEVKKGKLVILYYYAKWCPICAQETVGALYPFFDTITDDRIVGFRINFNDFDTDRDEIAMAKKYQIAYQHTKVFERNGVVLLKDGQEWNRAQYDIALADILKQL